MRAKAGPVNRVTCPTAAIYGAAFTIRKWCGLVYVTPKVVAEGYQEDARGERLKGTLREYVVARQVELDLSRELADTRIAPDEQAAFDYRAQLKARAVALVFRVRVEPDAFYTDFYRSRLEGNPAGKGSGLIKQALEDSLASHFTFYTSRQSLPR